MGKTWIVGLIAALLMLQGAAALAANEGRVEGTSGTVVAVTEGTKTVVIQSTLKGKPWIVGAVVTDSTKFGGKAKALKDIKAGDKVTMQWVRQAEGDIARSITLR